MTQKKLETCPYVNRHKFCQKCGQDNPKVCIEGLEPDVVERVEEKPAAPLAHTLTFEKPTRGRGKR